MRVKRVILWSAGALLALLAVVGLVLVLARSEFLLDWEGRPYCHKGIMFGFKIWMEENGLDMNSNTNAFPNVGGVGRDSLAAIREGMGGHMDWAKSYRYVPGLREDDPGHLVLMYFDRPTRWTWHGPAPTIFTKKAWILVPVDFDGIGRHREGPGELSERVSPDRFKTRLRETLEFLQTNARPHWQTVVAEHRRFLESLEDGTN